MTVVSLKEQITNPYYSFILLQTSETDKRKAARYISAARNAFLYIIRTKSAFEFKKFKVLKAIAAKLPTLLRYVSYEDIQEHFERHCELRMKEGKIVTTSEMKWIHHFVTDDATRLAMEKLLLQRLLIYRKCDEMRRKYKWSFSEEEIREFARGLTNEVILSVQRLRELSVEFDIPQRQFEQEFEMFECLYQREYEKADALGEIPDTVIYRTLHANLNNGYFSDALILVQRYLPDHTDMHEEIKLMKETVKAFGQDQIDE